MGEWYDIGLFLHVRDIMNGAPYDTKSLQEKIAIASDDLRIHMTLADHGEFLKGLDCLLNRKPYDASKIKGIINTYYPLAYSPQQSA